MGVGETAWLNGNLVEPSRLTIPLMSNAVFRGTSVFDVMPIASIDGVPHAIGLEPHLERLMGSARQMGLDHGFEVDDLVAAVRSLAAPHDSPMIARTVIANAGGSGGGSTSDVMTAMTVEPWHREAIESVRLDTASAKIPATIIPTHVKVAAIYAGGMRAETDATAAGFDGIVNMAPDGAFLEGVSASVGLVIDGAVHLPPRDRVLDSITRRLAEDVAAAQGIQVVVAELVMSDVERSSGSFIASSTKMVVPVAQIGTIDLDPADAVVVSLRTGVDEVIGGRHELSPAWLTPLVSGS